MLLSENRGIIDALNIILEDYHYLEYNQKRSQGQDYLYVEVIDRTVHRNEDVIHRIHSALRRATGKMFRSPAIVGSGSDWTFFRIRKNYERHKTA